MRAVSSVVVAVLMVCGAGVATVAPASAQSPAWSVAPSVSPPGAPNGALTSVACATATTCFAVGHFVNGPVMEQWNGAQWSIVTLPTADSLSDVACPSATSCFAVGGFTSAVIDSWDGATWSVVPSAAASALLSVECTSTSACFAVGRAGSQAFVEKWDGTSWSIVASPHPVKAVSSYFVGVACATPTNCSAVGSSYDRVVARPLIDHWNGSAWSIVPSPAPTSSTLPVLNSVSCASNTSCFAVGSIQNFSAQASITKTLIVQWNGAKWSVVASPNVAATISDSLSDVSCPSAASCFAVGSVTLANGELTHNVVARWNGSTWSIIASPNPSANGNGLSGVACSSSTSCFAVGSSGSVTSPGTIEHWNGASWSIVSHPMPMPSSSTLSAVSCASTTCFAVGQQSTPAGTVATLVEQPTASGWTVVASPNAPGSAANTLAAVSCPSTTLCIAVGTASTKTGSKTLVERWNGTAWSVMASPNHGTNSSGLTGVSCPSTTSCFAVGKFTNGGYDQTLTERWNGSTWSIVASPNLAKSAPFIGRDNDLASVSCATTISCIAVGANAKVAGGSGLGTKTFTFVERWSGSAWSIVTSPNPGTDANAFSSVSCPGANTCFAVGEFYSFGRGPLSQSLIARWNGTTWTRVTSADPATARATSLGGISCASPTSCVAVGGAAPGNGQYSTLVKSMTGASWSIGPSPNPVGGTNSFLNGVSCSSPTTCYAVGSFGPGGQFKQTLVETYA